ncbi:hypothetical protein SDC9_121578 [bioreactor metagenome]|uniref:Uncharacterized protein n=1 Tax=bioreactor metagenome TaxID=1076179 RepID=A0A645CCD3_9ZZZZ
MNVFMDKLLIHKMNFLEIVGINGSEKRECTVQNHIGLCRIFHKFVGVHQIDRAC